MKHNGKREQTKKLKEETLVWLFNPNKKVERSPKLQIRLNETRYQVIGTLNDYVVRIETLDGKRKIVVHRNQRKEIKKTQRYDNQEVAVNDRQQRIPTSKQLMEMVYQ